MSSHLAVLYAARNFSLSFFTPEYFFIRSALRNVSVGNFILTWVFERAKNMFSGQIRKYFSNAWPSFLVLFLSLLMAFFAEPSLLTLSKGLIGCTNVIKHFYQTIEEKSADVGASDNDRYVRRFWHFFFLSTNFFVLRIFSFERNSKCSNFFFES